MCTPLAGGVAGWGISELSKKDRQEPRQNIIHVHQGSQSSGKNKSKQTQPSNSTKTNRSTLNTGMYS
tara:strand:+ start:486 stop:686 length:201 start_codon:yes stop_codon:yes gene_type:complete